MDQVVFNILASADTDQIRTETFNGREYTVVPVVALVQGVIQGANADSPELALSSEFGKYPQAWDGRPVVMNHPMVDDEFVHANSPEILEQYAFGTLFNTKIDQGKLKTEAWIDNLRVEEMGGEVAETVERIQSGEVVEVSTGLFASVELTSGHFNGLPYDGVWRNVAPDHLAFLSAGVIGACSVENGCGVPRLNQLRQVKTSSDCGCSCGGTCNSEGDQHMDPEDQDTITVERTEEARINKMQQRLEGLVANSYPGDMPVENVRKLLTSALENNDGCDFYYLYTFTQDQAIYEKWCGLELYSRSFTITDDTTVTLGDDETQVNLMTRVVPVINSADSETAEEPEEPRTQEDAETSTEKGESTMDPELETNTDPAATTEATETVETVATEETTETEVTANAAPKAMSAKEYIDQAPAEVREVLQESMRLHADRKAKLIDGIKSNSRNKFSEDALKAMSMTDLENIASLASVPTYAGQAGPKAQSKPEDNSPPAPIEAFPVNKRNAA